VAADGVIFDSVPGCGLVLVEGVATPLTKTSRALQLTAIDV
jgi:hypothetical protein